MNPIIASQRTLRRQRRRARSLSRYLLDSLAGIIAIATLVGVLVVGNSENARRALLESIGVDEGVRMEAAPASRAPVALAGEPIRAR